MSNLQLVGIIPTRDRPEDLKRLLASIDSLQLEQATKFQVIIVDNSADQSAKEIARLNTSKFPCAYIHEPVQGLSRARNAAITELAPNEYACMIDDDVILPTDYLLRVKRTIHKHSNAGVIGGRVELYDKHDAPETIKTSSTQVEFDGANGIFGFIHGCNMIIPQSTFEKIGFFDPKLGAGSKCRSAEDTDFYYRSWRDNLPVVYEPELYVFHNHGRRTEAAIKSLRRNYRIGQGAFYAKHLQLRNTHVAKLTYWQLRRDLIKMISVRSQKTTKVEELQAWSDRIKGALHYITT